MTRLRKAILNRKAATETESYGKRMRPLREDEAARLEWWVHQTTSGMGITDTNASVRAWCEAIRKSSAFVIAITDQVTLTVVVPPGTSVPAARAMATGRLAPALAAVHGALETYTSRKRQAHVVFVAEKTMQRTLPRVPGEPIQPHHINGGLTTFPSFEDPAFPWRSMVYRWSDALKVMIHELVHLHDVHVLPPDAAAERAFAARHRIALEPPIGRLAIQEALTEVLALYILCVWTSVLSNANFKDLIETVGDDSDALARTVSLRHFPGWTEGAAAAMFRDGTHAYAYIIARAALWSNGIEALVEALEGGSLKTTRDLLEIVAKGHAALIKRILAGQGRLTGRRSRATHILMLSPIQ
jgi:hypothetical protein